MNKYHLNKIKRKVNRSLLAKFSNECLVFQWNNGYVEWEPHNFKVCNW
jgi:hypothetical protein